MHNLKNISVDIPKNKLTVITGLSGSGKSSLAFDTLYAEGQRRYVESLSAYARQFLGVMDKPDVEAIEGLSPAIAIDQKSVSKNPRSTVGTITEIYDYLRLLFARVGQPHCPQCGRRVQKQSASQIVDRIIKEGRGQLMAIMAPLVRGRKGEHRGYLAQAEKAGFLRLRVDNIIFPTEEAIELGLDKKKKHFIEAVVDRVEAKKEERARIADSVEVALKAGQGLVLVVFGGQKKDKQKTKDKSKEILFSEHFACQECGLNLPQLEPRLFSFNSPFGACPDCQGIGAKQEIDPELIIPNRNLTLAEGAIRPWTVASSRAGYQGYYFSQLAELARTENFSLNKPVKNLTADNWHKILYGAGGFEGVIPNLERRWKETDSDWIRREIEKFMLIKECPTCRGRRLRPEALAVKVGNLSIDEIVSQSVTENKKIIKRLPVAQKLKPGEQKIAQPIVKEILNRLDFLVDVGLQYLTLDRGAITLSGGEGQRIRLATQIGSGLTGVLYILDEPSVGLHQRDVGRLISTLKYLRDLGNTVVVVEHDDQTILAGDWVVEIGPGAGARGGEVVFAGTPAQLKRKNTLTGRYLSGREKIDPREFKNKRLKQNKIIKILGAREHNLKNIDVNIPLARFVCVTGVSGSGKSTLINDILGRELMRVFYRAKDEPGAHLEIKGLEELDKVVIVDQSPIGRTPRSNPATYTGAFTHIRDLFAQTQEARLRGYQAGRFSFNVKGGRCEVCQGDGLRKIEMYFLPDIYVECEECHGQRYNKEALEIEYKGKNIAQVLEMSVEEALAFFRNIPTLKNKLKTIFDVGLGYIKLGQPATTLSGGEAQRIKLATELAKKATGRTLYILDEPTTGLHAEDVKKLLGVLHRLVARGNTVLVVEHNPAVIRTADWIIDLGPEGGDNGGRVVAVGELAKIKASKKSYTGRYL